MTKETRNELKKIRSRVRSSERDPLARFERHARRISWVSFILLTLAVPAGNAVASCFSAPIFHGITSSFEQCGTNAAAFAWLHGRAVQRIFGPPTPFIGEVSGHDSGRNQTFADFMMLEGPNGATHGSYLGATDFANPGWDGCVFRIPEDGLSCKERADFGVLDYVIGGVDPSSPDVVRMAVLSVDLNEVFQAHVLDNAGAPSVDGDPCGSMRFRSFPAR